MSEPTTKAELVEAVEAIARGFGQGDDVAFNLALRLAQQLASRLPDACEAHEPSAEMVLAGVDRYVFWNPEHRTTGEMVVEIYRAMEAARVAAKGKL